MKSVRAKKHLGQHFLNDMSIAQRIVNSLEATGVNQVLEVGPGMGVLTQYLLQREEFETHVVELDTESVEYLNENFPALRGRIMGEDFLNMSLDVFQTERFALIGNFPYNISSQIFFKVLDNKEQVTEVVGMLQKEVAERITGVPGNKTYGILSVLVQAFYDVEYLFTVGPEVFTPPPKVQSAVIRLVRNKVTDLGCDPVLFKQIIKATFNQRRKMLRNTLKPFLANCEVESALFTRRPEELSVAEFVELTNIIARCKE